MTRRAPTVGYLITLLALLAGPFSTAAAQERPWDQTVPVAAGSDDTEEFVDASLGDAERWPAGFSYAESSDLELGYDSSHGPQLVGLRFEGVSIPEGATLSEAVVAFTADSTNGEPLELVIEMQSGAEPAPFVQDADGETSSDLSSRPTTGQAVPWSPQPWEAGEEYRTPDLSPLLQGVLRPGELQGQTIVLLFRPAGESSGAFRSAYAYDARADAAPRLLLRFQRAGETGQAEAANAAGETREEAPTPGDPDGGEAREEPAATTEPAEPASEAEQEEPAAEDPAAEDPAGAPVEAEPAQPGAQADAAQEASADEAGASAIDPGRQEVEVTPVVPDAPVGEANEAQEAEDGTAAGADTAAQTQVAAGQVDRQRFPLIPDGPNGPSGSVLVSDYGLGGSIIAFSINNPAPNAQYRITLNTGSCGSVGEMVALLEPVEVSLGLSTSIVDQGFSDLVSGGYHLNLFRIDGGMTRTVACVELGT